MLTLLSVTQSIVTFTRKKNIVLVFAPHLDKQGRFSPINEKSYEKLVNAKKFITAFAEFDVKNSCFCKVPEEPEKDVKMISYSTELKLKYTLCKLCEETTPGD